MNDYGKLIAPKTLYFERLLPGPIERVWKHLTDAELRGKWFASGPMEEKAGGNITFQFYHSNLSGEADPVPQKYKEHEKGSESRATVLVFDPPHVLSIHWENSEVTFELAEQQDRVLLKLTHKALPTDRGERIGVMAGWHTHLNILRDVLKQEAPEGFWKVHMRLEDEYEQTLS